MGTTTPHENVNVMALDHHSTRAGAAISAIVLHYPAPNNAFEKPYSVEAVHALLDHEKLSYHYYIEKNARITEFVPEARKAWHAGESSLFGRQNVNFVSIGICLENNGGEEYPEQQIKAAAAFCREIANWHKIPMNRIVGHCHVSPDRKSDPGPKFPWFNFFKLF